jgi:hypothetical protein
MPLYCALSSGAMVANTKLSEVFDSLANTYVTLRQNRYTVRISVFCKSGGLFVH